MELILKFVINYLCFVEIIDAKMMRVQPNEEVYSYTIDPSVPPFTEYISIENLTIEQIDDEKVEIGGYDLFVKSMNPRMPLQLDVKTKYLQNSVWNDAPIRLTVPSVCPEFLNPTRFWYNITKLFTNCPPQKGDKWVVEHQLFDWTMNFPPSVPSGAWQGFFMLYQFGTNHKIAFMMQIELREMD